MHIFQPTESQLDEFCTLITDHCKFVDDWDDPRIPTNALHIFGKHAAAEAEEERLLARLCRSRMRVLVKKADDQETMMGSHGDWKQASQDTSKRLNKNVKKPDLLYLYRNAMLEITYNDSRDRWSQSQLACLCDLPSEETLRTWGDIKVLVAPAGTKSSPDEVQTKQELLSFG